MILPELKNIRSGRKELRSFSIILAVASLVIAGYISRRGEMLPVYFLILGGGFGLASLFIPKFLVPLYRIWMSFGIVVGTIASYIILTVVFILVVTPIGIFTRLLGKDFLNFKLDKSRPSYWEYREQPEATEDYLKQF